MMDGVKGKEVRYQLSVGNTQFVVMELELLALSPPSRRMIVRSVDLYTSSDTCPHQQHHLSCLNNKIVLLSPLPFP
jgi:hypothetical protein